MITDEMITEAAVELNDAMLKGLPNTYECMHEFSAEFEKKMKRVIGRANHPIRYRVLQKTACFALVLILGFVTVLTVSPTARAAVFGWIREQYESFTSYHFEDTADAADVPVAYYIEALPSEYSEIAISDDAGNFTAIYSDLSGQLLNFSYSTSPNAANYFLTEEDYRVEEAHVQGHVANVYLSNDSLKCSSIIWCDENQNTIFFISGILDKDELLILAKSVTQKNN